MTELIKVAVITALATLPLTACERVQSINDNREKAISNYDLEANSVYVGNSWFRTVCLNGVSYYLTSYTLTVAVDTQNTPIPCSPSHHVIKGE